MSYSTGTTAASDAVALKGKLAQGLGAARPLTAPSVVAGRWLTVRREGDLLAGVVEFYSTEDSDSGS